MIKLLRLLFTFVTLYGGEILFPLPNHHTLFVHQLKKALKDAPRILIITPSFNHPLLEKEILNAAKRGSDVTLMVHDPRGNPLSMVQYERINLYTIPRAVEQSVFLIDDTLVCTVDGAIHEKEFASKHSPIRCSDDSGKIKAIRYSIHPVMKHSRSYLE